MTSLPKCWWNAVYIVRGKVTIIFEPPCIFCHYLVYSIFQSTQYIDFAIGTYELKVEASCEGLKSTSFSTKLRGREGVDLFVYAKQDTLGVIQVGFTTV